MRHTYAQKEGRSNIKYISANLVNAVVISFKYQIDKKHGNGREAWEGDGAASPLLCKRGAGDGAGSGYSANMEQSWFSKDTFFHFNPFFLI